MDANKIHFEQENLQREFNLEEDLDVWKFILTLKDDEVEIEGINDKENFKIKYYDRDKASRDIKKFPNNLKPIEFFRQRTKTICQKIWNMRTLDFNLQKEEQMKFAIVKKFTKMLLNCPKEIQLEFTRPPKKQSINEKISFNTLKKYLNNNLWNVEKPANGEWVVEEERIRQNPGHQRQLANKARSVDFIISSKQNQNFKFYGFAKFSQAKGSGQGLQAGEAKTFLNECKDYCDANDDKNYFFCLIDGIEGGKAVKKLKPLVRHYNDRIYIGNSFEIIQKISKHEV